MNRTMYSTRKGGGSIQDGPQTRQFDPDRHGPFLRWWNSYQLCTDRTLATDRSNWILLYYLNARKGLSSTPEDSSKRSGLNSGRRLPVRDRGQALCGCGFTQAQSGHCSCFVIV